MQEKSHGRGAMIRGEKVPMMRESFNPLWIFLLARDREEGRYVGM